jgi:tetratricopeptide (TPR) repeat protein
MPEPTSNSGQHLLPVEPPEWLTQAVAPWRVEAAALWRSGGVQLLLRSERARVPVLVACASAGPLTMSLLDARIPPQKGAAFVRALELRLRHAAPLRSWLLQLRALAELLNAERAATNEQASDQELARWIVAWRAWPEREANPRDQVPELPAALWARAGELPRATAAALTLYRFARGELLEALCAWEALPQTSAELGFVEHHLDVIALGLLGRRAEAIATLARAEAVAHEAEAWLAIARGYEALEQREAAVAAHERVVALRGRDWDRLRLARARGGFSANDALPKPNPAASLVERTSVVRELVKICEEAARHDEILAAIDELADAAPLDLVVRAAELHLWRGELAQARARLEAVAEAARDERAQLILGAALVLEGHPAAGLAMLEQIEGTGNTRLERLLWQAEAHLALDQLEQALDHIDQHIVLENSLVAYLLKLLTLVRREPSETLERSLESRTFLDALVQDVLPTLRPAEQIAAARAHPDRFVALLRGILDEMGGNRGPRSTWCRRGADGVVRLEPVRTRLSGRDAAVANLIRIRTEPPDAVLEGFDAVLREYPTSPHAYTYMGELLIWLGRYEQALASFDQADARAPTRWSYVGRAAAYDLLGQAELADHWTHEGARQFGELETATTHVYRGERLRKLGAWADARRDLETALAFKTRRIGARINLALTYRALGETQAWEQQLARLRVDAPAFVWEAGGRADASIDESTLLTMLELMVGNRSSFLHTMIDRSGQFRVVPDPNRWIAHARLCVALGRDELGRELAARWLSRP